MSITTDKAPTYKRILAEMNEFGFPGEEIIHVDKKWQNNRIESDHAASNGQGNTERYRSSSHDQKGPRL